MLLKYPKYPFFWVILFINSDPAYDAFLVTAIQIFEIDQFFIFNPQIIINFFIILKHSLCPINSRTDFALLHDSSCPLFPSIVRYYAYLFPFPNLWDNNSKNFARDFVSYHWQVPPIFFWTNGPEVKMTNADSGFLSKLRLSLICSYICFLPVQ